MDHKTGTETFDASYGETTNESRCDRENGDAQRVKLGGPDGETEASPFGVRSNARLGVGSIVVSNANVHRIRLKAATAKRWANATNNRKRSVTESPRPRAVAAIAGW